MLSSPENIVCFFRKIVGLTAVTKKVPIETANQWQSRLQDVAIADHGLVLFMQAARWADDIRTRDKAQNTPSWYYVNLPFKPEDQPVTVQIREPAPVNILTTLAENENAVKNGNDPKQRAIALAWLVSSSSLRIPALTPGQIFSPRRLGAAFEVTNLLMLKLPNALDDHFFLAEAETL